MAKHMDFIHILASTARKTSSNTRIADFLRCFLSHKYAQHLVAVSAVPLTANASHRRPIIRTHWNITELDIPKWLLHLAHLFSENNKCMRDFIIRRILFYVLMPKPRVCVCVCAHNDRQIFKKWPISTIARDSGGQERRRRGGWVLRMAAAVFLRQRFLFRASRKKNRWPAIS